MDWDKWDIVALGRSAGALVIVVGIIVSGWIALDDPEGFTSFSARAFLLSVLNYTWTGGMLILVAEIAERLGWLGRDLEEEILVEQEDLASPPVEQELS